MGPHGVRGALIHEMVEVVEDLAGHAVTAIIALTANGGVELVGLDGFDHSVGHL
jgi:hypothetical protein